MKHNTDLFKRKLIITMPPFGLYVIGASIALTAFIPNGLRMISNVVCIVAAVACMAAAWQARRALREIRFSMHRILHDIGNEELDMTETPSPVLRVPRKQIGKVNGYPDSSTRLPR